MFISNDSNYAFGQFLANENGDDIKAPVYTKCFTDTEELKGYRFIHDPEETDPEKCVSFSVYDAVSEEATATPFLNKAAVADLTSVMFRLDAKILDDGAIRELPFYHVIVPVENITDGTLKYLVIQMTKEVEIFPENYPYYELVDTFTDAQPTSAEVPTSGGGESDFSTCTVKLINSVEGLVDVSVANIVEMEGIETSSGFAQFTYNSENQDKTIILYKGVCFLRLLSAGNLTATGDIEILSSPVATIGAQINGDGTITYSPIQQ